MGGKSTLLRSCCVAVIMAQIGCYVAADRALLDPVDAIFTRIGVGDVSCVCAFVAHAKWLRAGRGQTRVVLSAVSDSCMCPQALTLCPDLCCCSVCCATRAVTRCRRCGRHHDRSQHLHG